MLCNWNESNLKTSTSINWRASLVPAAAVIPAPIAYVKVAAVKKLVVEDGLLRFQYNIIFFFIFFIFTIKK